MNEKNDSDFYDKSYLEKPMCGAQSRWEDNGIFYGAAIRAKAILDSFGGKSVLDVGCGRGFVVCHLRNLGVLAEGCEYGNELVEHSVCRSTWCDLTDKLPYEDASFDLVICLGVLSQFPAEYAPTALCELHRVSSRYLWTNTQVEPERLIAYHKNVSPPDWWIGKFAEAGWKFSSLEEPFKPGTMRWSAIWKKYV